MAPRASIYKSSLALRPFSFDTRASCHTDGYNESRVVSFTLLGSLPKGKRHQGWAPNESSLIDSFATFCYTWGRGDPLNMSKKDTFRSFPWGDRGTRMPGGSEGVRATEVPALVIFPLRHLPESRTQTNAHPFFIVRRKREETHTSYAERRSSPLVYLGCVGCWYMGVCSRRLLGTFLKLISIAHEGLFNHLSCQPNL